MYRTPCPEQLSFENFYLPFGGKLSATNRWVQLADLIPWHQFESEYAQHFSEDTGAPAKGFRLALGALIIKEKLGTSDRETLEQIRENPYLQYFLGLSEFCDTPPFDSSMFVHFRKRLPLDVVLKINEFVVLPMLDTDSNELPLEESEPSPDTKHDDSPSDSPLRGQLILDATCAPADICYPTDLDLLNAAREYTETIIDQLHQQCPGHKKPRTYRQLARKSYLAVAKKRRPSHQQLRQGKGKQLRYLRRNLGHIDKMLEMGASLAGLSKRLYRLLLIVSEVYRQQQSMYEQKVQRIEDRIVSLAQPHVRPIVRGKVGQAVEFGAKLSASSVEGYVFLERLSWDNYNESVDLIEQVERYRERFGHYPESVHADKIYRTRANIKWCKERGIRLSGPPLGRPSQDPERKAELKKQAQEDEKVRVEIEGKFGQAKRRFSLSRVQAKLAETAATAIAVIFLVMNLCRRLSRILFLWLLSWLTDVERVLRTLFRVYRSMKAG